MELGVWAGTPPATTTAPSAAALPSPGCAAQPAAGRVVEDKENVLPSGTPRGGPQLPNLAGGSAAGSGGHKGGKAEGQDKPGRRPLGDVTHHYAAASKGIYIGALGGAFGMVEGVPAASCRQEAAAAAEAQAAAARARAAAAKRQALRSMR